MDKIICIGKNYLKHAQELGDAVPTEPVYFMKPASTVLQLQDESGILELPNWGECHHELELVLRVDKIYGKLGFGSYTFGLDLTLRDVQTRMKKSGLPWERAKVFRNASVLGPWQPLSSLDQLLSTSFTLTVNNQVRQRGQGRDMRWKPQELLEDLLRLFPVCEQDVVFTGTPEGVAELKDGDHVVVEGGDVRYAFTCRKGNF
ncbi:MAG: fumarylacetoacetate hydrolase family protein [Bdellovibrionales bacterium]